MAMERQPVKTIIVAPDMARTLKVDTLENNANRSHLAAAILEMAVEAAAEGQDLELTVRIDRRAPEGSAFWLGQA